ncbi:MAG: hypothetical protein WC119_00975 [Synergistaceae bacterium]
MISLRQILLIFILLSCLSCSAIAQIITPFHVHAPGPIVDEFNRNLLGTANNPQDKVLILRAEGGIFPSQQGGIPDPRNPQISGGEGGIGKFTSRSQDNTGRFGLVIGSTNRPPHGIKVFARVFNDPVPSRATFYGDSQIFTINYNDVFVVELGKTDKPIYPEDSDGDGLNDSWEMSLDTDPMDIDTDNDGYTDYIEFLSGRNPLGEDKDILITGIARLLNDWYAITWESTINARYIIQSSSDLLMPFEDISGVITAITEVTTESVCDTNEIQFFRIKQE